LLFARFSCLKPPSHLRKSAAAADSPFSAFLRPSNLEALLLSLQPRPVLFLLWRLPRPFGRNDPSMSRRTEAGITPRSKRGDSPRSPGRATARVTSTAALKLFRAPAAVPFLRSRPTVKTICLKTPKKGTNALRTKEPAISLSWLRLTFVKQGARTRMPARLRAAIASEMPDRQDCRLPERNQASRSTLCHIKLHQKSGELPALSAGPLTFAKEHTHT